IECCARFANLFLQPSMLLFPTLFLSLLLFQTTLLQRDSFRQGRSLLTRVLKSRILLLNCFLKNFTPSLIFSVVIFSLVLFSCYTLLFDYAPIVFCPASKGTYGPITVKISPRSGKY